MTDQVFDVWDIMVADILYDMTTNIRDRVQELNDEELEELKNVAISKSHSVDISKVILGRTFARLNNK